MLCQETARGQPGSLEQMGQSRLMVGSTNAQLLGPHTHCASGEGWKGLHKAQGKSLFLSKGAGMGKHAIDQHINTLMHSY